MTREQGMSHLDVAQQRLDFHDGSQITSFKLADDIVDVLAKRCVQMLGDQHLQIDGSAEELNVPLTHQLQDEQA